MYNEMVVLKLVQSMTKLICSPPEVFSDIIHDHFRENGDKFYTRIKSWMKLSEEVTQSDDDNYCGAAGDEGRILLRKQITKFNYSYF